MAVIKYWDTTENDWVPVATVGGTGGASGTAELKTEVVSALPTSGIDTSTVYLLHCENADGQDNYDEYMFINGGWERFGSRDSAIETIVSGNVTADNVDVDDIF